MRPGLASVQMTNAPFAQAIPSSARVQTQVLQDVMAPRLDVMRSIPSISSAALHLLAQYEDRADQEAFPGKTSNIRKKSVRYNVTDTSLVSPQYRWPNEGLVSSSHFKKPAYDELNMAQWISGHLNNMLLVEDNTTLRISTLPRCMLCLGGIHDGHRRRNVILD